MKHKFRSLSSTMALSFLILNVSTLLIISGFIFYLYLKNQYNLINAQQSIIAENATFKVAKFLQDKFDCLEKTADLTNLINGAPSEQKNILNKLIGREQAFRQLHLLSSKGKILARTSRFSEALSAKLVQYRPQELIAQVKTQQHYVGPIYIDQISHEPIITIAVGVNNVLGNLTDVLLAEINLKYMWDIIEQARTDGLIYVVDSNGFLIAHQDTTRVLKRENVKHLYVVQNLFGTKQEASLFNIHKGIQGNLSLTNYTFFEKFGFAVIVESPINEVFYPLFAGTLFCLLLIIISYLVTIVIGRNIARRVSRPLQQLTDATQKISEGDFNSTLDCHCENEIGLLASSFEKMVSKLKESKDKIEDYSRTLEQKVDEKTQQIKQQQQNLIQSSKLATLGEMAGGIAHEINNPLAIINGYSKLIDQHLAQDNIEPHTLKQLNSVIQTTTMRITEIITGLRSFSREGANDPQKIISVKKIIEKTLSLCMEKMKNHNINISFSDISADLTVECREVQIEQVLLNLLNNAYDAIATQNERWIKISCTEAESKIIISVIDSGAGVDPAIIDRIFEPFFTTKEVGKGTGLGLSVSYGILKEHNGNLVYDRSHPNSKFDLILPKS